MSGRGRSAEGPGLLFRAENQEARSHKLRIHERGAKTKQGKEGAKETRRTEGEGVRVPHARGGRTGGRVMGKRRHHPAVRGNKQVTCVFHSSN